MSLEYDGLWVFNGAGGKFASAIFESKSDAEAWIANNALTGVLTKYPVNVGVHDWAVGEEIFAVKKDEHRTSEFIGRFTCAGMIHYHYEDGEGD